jgi:signal peptidase I
VAKDTADLKKKKQKPVEPEKPQKPKETTAEFVQSIASLLAVGLFIITFCLQAFEIPSSSMENTLLIGDHVFVDRVRLAPKAPWMKLTPYRDPQRGDIVVFLSPSTPGLYVVKRVIGIPGDRIHLQNKNVYRNGQLLDESKYVQHISGSYVPYRDEFPAVSPDSGMDVTPEWQLTMPSHMEGGDIVVPPGAYFGMGDNRDVSLDSRFWGFIPRENIIGRPMFIYWSFEEPPGQYQRTSIGERVGYVFHIIIHFFDETRWSRMLRLVR